MSVEWPHERGVGAAKPDSRGSTAQNDGPVIVNVDNFVQAETAAQFDRALKFTGGVNKWFQEGS